MEILEGVIDVFLGDFRYGNDSCAKELSDVDGYFEVVSRNFKTAYESAEVMLRHLVLPGHLECCTRPVMEWVRDNIPGVYFNLMFQYRPEYRASLFPGMNRRLSADERNQAVQMATEYGLEVS
jgi:putative pyruvate formate lyase activating enzyme